MPDSRVLAHGPTLTGTPGDLRKRSNDGAGLQLFCDDDERLNMLGLLLESLGADAAVRLGDPAVWREAVAGLE